LGTWESAGTGKLSRHDFVDLCSWTNQERHGEGVVVVAVDGDDEGRSATLYAFDDATT